MITIIERDNTNSSSYDKSHDESQSHTTLIYDTTIQTAGRV